jgi:diguanylate cyclase (GGDEF)-like protein
MLRHDITMAFMVDPIRLEKGILTAISLASHDNWASFSIGDLRRRLSEMDRSLAGLSHEEVVDCICSLEVRSLIAAQKFQGGRCAPFERSRSSDDHYRGQFFAIESFQLKLTHEGRKALGDMQASVATSAEQMDDRLPLFRRKAFDAELERAEKEILAAGTPFALVMIDVDKFSQVNNTYGHPTGDEVLLAISSLIANRVRGKGKPYRYGGEEIAVLLLNYCKMEATALAETIRIELERSQMTGKNLRITASFGVAAAPEDASTSKEILQLADDALREAKRLGRNLVRAVGDSDDVEVVLLAHRKQPESQGAEIQSKNDFARVLLQPRRVTNTANTIKVVEVFGTIENLSHSRRIREYSVTLSVPGPCLDFSLTHYSAEVQSQDPNYRRLRHTERDQGGVAIHPGDRLQIISASIAVGHLSKEVLEECIAMDVIADAVVDGEALQARKTVRELMGE